MPARSKGSKQNGRPRSYSIEQVREAVLDSDWSDDNLDTDSDSSSMLRKVTDLDLDMTLTLSA